MVAETYNLSTWEALAGEFQVQGQPWLHNEIYNQKNEGKKKETQSM
jgi:hypothetical protein